MKRIEWYQTKEEEKLADLEHDVKFSELPDNKKWDTLFTLMTFWFRDKNGHLKSGYMESKKKIIVW